MKRRDRASLHAGHKLQVRLVRTAHTSGIAAVERQVLSEARTASKNDLTAALAYQSGLVSELLRLLREQDADVDFIVDQIANPQAHATTPLRDFDGS